jgi:hypothetical protein
MFEPLVEHELTELFSDGDEESFPGNLEQGEKGQGRKSIAAKFDSIIFTDAGVGIPAKEPQGRGEEIMDGSLTALQDFSIGNIPIYVEHGPDTSGVTKDIISIQKAAGLGIVSVSEAAVLLSQARKTRSALSGKLK